jgi:RHS repeat-associated protein
MSKSKWAVGFRSASSRASRRALLFAVLAFVAFACQQHDDVGNSLPLGSAAGGAPPIGVGVRDAASADTFGSKAALPESPTDERDQFGANKQGLVDAATKAFLAEHSAQPANKEVEALSAHVGAGRAKGGAGGSSDEFGPDLAPKFGSPTKVLDLGVCSALSLTTAPDGPIAAWINVGLIADAQCSGGATPMYRFAIAPAGTTNYTYLTEWTVGYYTVWHTTGVTPGDYDLVAFAKAATSTAEYDAVQKRAINVRARCATAALYAVASSDPNVVTLNLSATPCPDPEFQYYYAPLLEGPWVQINAGWTTAGSVTFDMTSLPRGTYMFMGIVRQHGWGNGDASNGKTYQLGPGCRWASLSASPTGPQATGSHITYAVSAQCDPGLTPEFSFNYAPVGVNFLPFPGLSGWQSQTQAVLDTTGFAGALHVVRVRLRAIGHVGYGEFWTDQYLMLNGPIDSLPTDTPLVQDFNQLGTAAAASLPSGWRIDSQATPNLIGTYAAAALQTTRAAGAALDPNAENGIYNFGAGVANSQAATYWLNSTDRAPGWLSAGSTLTTGGTKSGNLYVAFHAPVDKDLTGLFVGYDVEKYKQGTNPSGFRVQLFSSTDGANWTSAGNSFLSQFAADSSNAGYDPAPGNSVAVAPKRLNTSIPRNSTFYLAWNYTLNSPTAVDGGNAQALAIDKVSLKGDVCVENCAEKHCGDSLDDGCGGTCAAVCGAGEVGCKSNADCAPNLQCAKRSPDPQAPRVCVSLNCTAACSSACACTNASACSSTTECASGFSCVNGACACQPSCNGKACGASDGCGGICEDGCGPGDSCQPGGCSPGLTCGPGGVCVGPSLPLDNGTPPPFHSIPSDEEAILSSASPDGRSVPGRLAGAPGVDASGAFSYRIPIEVPAGRAGMQPHLAFSYSSSNGNGLLGVGWRLEGLSAITRCPKIRAREGTPDSVKVRFNYCELQSPENCQYQFSQYNPIIDNFCLDGEKLVNVGGSPTNPEFRTERDSFARVVATYDGQKWPSKFTVQRRDGTVAIYDVGAVASGTDARDLVTGEADGQPYSGVLAWPVTTVRDQSGNAVSYNYGYGDTGSAVKIIQSIEYTTCAPTFPCPYGGASRIVKFNYESRTDYLSHWAAGLNAGVGVRLNSVDVLTGDDSTAAQVKSYKLAYDTSAATSRARLVSMKLCDGKDLCQSPTLFRWGSKKGPDYRPTWHVIGPDGPGAVSPGQCTGPVPAHDCFFADYQFADLHTSSGSDPFLIADFDGNGTDDILLHGSGFPDGDVPFDTWLNLSFVEDGRVTVQGVKLPNDIGGEVQNEYWAARAVDIDQDGQAELIVPNAHFEGLDGKNVTISGYRVYRYSAFSHSFVLVRHDEPDDTSAITLATPSGIGLTASRTGPRTIGMLDTDGDGVLDYYYQTNSLLADGHGQAYSISKAVPSPTSLLPVGYTPPSSLWYQPAPADQELYEQGRCALQPVDYAGHGYNSLALVCSDTDSEISFGDMNGDGLSDIVRMNHGSQPFASVRLSTGVEVLNDLPGDLGSGVVRPEAQALPPTLLATDQFAADEAAYPPRRNRVVDMNGDGLADIIQFETSPSAETPTIWLSENHANGPSIRPVKLPHSQERYGGFDQQVGDFNGDGLPDIVQAVQYDVNQSGSVKLQYLVQDPSNRDDVLTQVVSDDVNLADVTYKAGPTEQLGPGGEATVGPAHGLFRPLKGLNVVTRATYIEGGAEDSYSYSYVGPAADTHGRGFLGFSAILRANFERGIKVTSFYDNLLYEGTLSGYHVFPYALVPRQITITTGAEALADLDPPVPIESRFVETRHEHVEVQRRVHVLSAGLGYDARYFVENFADSDERQDDAIGTYYATSNSRTYDDYGNVVELDSDDNGEQASTVRTVVNDSSDRWFIGQLQNSSTTHWRLGLAAPAYAQTTTPQLKEYTWYPNGQLHTVTSKPGDWRTKTYTVIDRGDAGLPKSVVTTDAFGNERAAAFEYSSDGVYREHTVNALGHETWVGYHSGLGVPLLSFDENNVETTYKYDGFGRPRSIAPTRGAVTTITYEQAAGALASTTTQTPGTRVRRQYTPFGRLAAVGSVIGGRTSTALYDFDSLGRLRSTTPPTFDDGPLGVPTIYEYDNLDNVRVVTNPDFSTVTVNLLDPLTTETIVSSSDDKTHDTVVTRTGDGLITSVRENAPGQAVATRGVDYVYGQNKGLYQVNELGGPTTTYYSYGLPKPAVVISSESGQTGFEYDGFFNVHKVTHDQAYPATEQYDYDSLGRTTLITTTMPDPATPTETLTGRTAYKYDLGVGAIGRIANAISPDGVLTQYRYTPEGLLREKEYDSGSDAFAIDYEYDDFGRISHIDYPTGTQPRLGLDLNYNDGAATGDGSLASITRGATSYWSDPVRGPTGVAESVKLSPDLTQTLDVDPRTRRMNGVSVTQVDGTAAYDVEYTYYAGGNVKTRTDELAGTNEQYEYDAYDQLSKWTNLQSNGSTTFGYSYDQLGNQTTTGAWNKTFGGTGYSPHQLAKQVAPLVIKRYSYDPLGRQTSWSENLAVQRTVTYTPFDLPRTVTTTQPSARTVTYAYDADQHRFSQSDGRSATTYVDDLYERRVDATTGETKNIFYIFAEGQRIAQLTQSGAGETVVRLYSDALGSVTGVDAGHAHQAFSPWGERLSLASTPQSTISDVTTGFTDQEHDDGVGLINMRGRVYDPAARIFLTPDPIVSSLKIAGWNKYAYVSNNPLKYADPSGLEGVESTTVDPVDGEVITFNDEQLFSSPMSVAPTSSASFEAGQCSDAGCDPARIDNGGGGTGPDLGFIRDAINYENSATYPDSGPLHSDDIVVSLPTHGADLTAANGGGEGTGAFGPKYVDSPAILGTLKANVLMSMAPPPEFPEAEGTEALLAAETTSAVVQEGKLGYLLGQASGRVHNLARALQNAGQLARVGVQNTAAGRALLQSHLQDVAADATNVVETYSNEYGSYVVKESLFSGPGGFLKLESTWEVTEGGTLRLTSAIPFGG